MGIDWEQVRREIAVTAARSGGAGGQNVNKRNTKATVRWSAVSSRAFNADALHQHTLQRLGRKLTQTGDLLVTSERYRTLDQNREDALARFLRIVRTAMRTPKARKKTAIPRSKKLARLDEKKRIAGKKASRSGATKRGGSDGD